jgi:hypothetical protein
MRVAAQAVTSLVPINLSSARLGESTLHRNQCSYCCKACLHRAAAYLAPGLAMQAVLEATRKDSKAADEAFGLPLWFPRVGQRTWNWSASRGIHGTSRTSSMLESVRPRWDISTKP